MKPTDIGKSICLEDYVIDRQDGGELRQIARFGEIDRGDATVFMADGGVMALSEISSDDILLESEAENYTPEPVQPVGYDLKPATRVDWAPPGDVNPQWQAKRRASDSVIASAIQDLEPKLVACQYGKAIAALDDHFRQVLEEGGPQAGRYLLERIWLIMGERRAAVNHDQEVRSAKA